MSYCIVILFIQEAIAMTPCFEIIILKISCTPILYISGLPLTGDVLFINKRMHQKAQLYFDSCKSIPLILYFHYSVTDTALNVRVNFDSPVTEGENVDITCTFDDTESRSDDLFVRWYRKPTGLKTQLETIGNWEYDSTISGGIKHWFQSNALKFEYINQTFHDGRVSHHIKLLYVEESDEGLYWCFVVFKGGEPSGHSNKEQLDVGE